jgi:hypothetical protein
MLLGVIFPMRAAAQQSVRGTVRDTAGIALGGAEVHVGDRRTQTDSIGAFRVDNLSPGKYVLTIRLLGYSPVRTQVAVVEAGPTELEYYLTVVPVRLPPVLVNVNRTGIYGAVGDTGYRKAVGAKVQLLGTHSATVLTDSLGRFAFPDAHNGQFMVRVTFGGYSERRLHLELKKNEGREIVVLLAPSREQTSKAEETAMFDLSRRLSMGLRREQLTPSELTRRGNVALCDLPLIKSELGSIETTLILNGTTVYSDWPVASLCNWSVDDVELVEFGKDYCAEVTRTVSDLLGAWCSARTRNVPRSINPAGSVRRQTTGRGSTTSRSYIIIWEKR